MPDFFQFGIQFGGFGFGIRAFDHPPPDGTRTTIGPESFRPYFFQITLNGNEYDLSTGS